MVAYCTLVKVTRVAELEIANDEYQIFHHVLQFLEAVLVSGSIFILDMFSKDCQIVQID